MLRAGRRCSQSRSVHTLKVRVTQRGQGSIVRPHLPVALSVVWGDPGPARRPRGEGLGPQSTSGLSPPPGLRTTGVAPRPRPAPPHAPAPAPRRPRRRGLGPNARSAGNRPSFAGRRHPPPPPPSRQRASTGLRARPHHPGPAGGRGASVTWRRRRGSQTLPHAECSALLSPSAPVASRPTTTRTRPETAGRR